jgi:hypothetical protein
MSCVVEELKKTREISVLAQQTDIPSMMAWMCIAGFFRGIALSNFTLTVSEYSSLEKLPAAFGW